jgi:hypothetical protein
MNDCPMGLRLTRLVRRREIGPLALIRIEGVDKLDEVGFRFSKCWSLNDFYYAHAI